MKEFEVYAIGNAIVDYEIRVNDQFFLDHGVEKGLMTLVDEDRQKELVEAVQSAIVKKQGGGSAANSMTAFSALGGKGFYSCKVANDKDGQFYLQDLHDHGLVTNLNVNMLPDGTTGKCLVMISPDAERTMNTYLGITSDFSETEIDESKLIDSEYLYIEGALIASTTGRVAMAKAKRIAEANNVKVSFTLWDPAMVKYFGDEMREVIGNGVELLFCNEEEALLYTGEKSINEARMSLKEIANKFVITRGKNGAVIWDGDTFIDIEPFIVEAVDSTGAGDMFAGAFLYGITSGQSFASSGKLASMASSQVVGQYGPRLTTDQLLKIKNICFS